MIPCRMERESFIVDLNDLADIRAKLTKAKIILREKQEELDSLRDLEREVADWGANVAFLTSKAQLPQEAEPNEQRAGSGGIVAGLGDLAVEVVNREVRKIRSRDVCAILRREGYDVSPNSVSNALYYAAHTGRKINTAPGRGFYAPLAYKEELIFDSTNGSESTSSNREAV